MAVHSFTQSSIVNDRKCIPVLLNRALLSAAALALLGGSLSSLHAEESAPVAAVVKADDSAGLPHFTPSADALAASFAPFAETVEVAVPPHAVDMETLAPAVEEAGQDLGEGVVSYYHAKFAGRSTANGEKFNPRELTAAHRTLPFGSRVRLTNEKNGRSVVVRVNDRGPFHDGRVMDVSNRAAEQLGLIAAGHGKVELELLDS